MDVLKRYNWNLELAVDMYFNDPSAFSVGKRVDQKKIESLFNKYKGMKEKENLARKDSNLTS